MVKLAQAGVNTQDAEIMDCVERKRRVSWLERREETRSRKTLRARPKAQSFLLWQCWALEESEGQGGARCYPMDQIGLQELTLLGEVGQVQTQCRVKPGRHHGNKARSLQSPLCLALPLAGPLGLLLGLINE